MKKIIFATAIAIVSFFTGCSNNNDYDLTQSAVQKLDVVIDNDDKDSFELTVDAFSVFGDMHNAFLENMVDNAENSFGGEVTTEDIANFNIEFALYNYCSSLEDAETWHTSFIKYQEFVRTEDFMAAAFGNTKTARSSVDYIAPLLADTVIHIEELPSCNTLYANIVAKKWISSSGDSIYKQMIELVDAMYKGELSDSAYKDGLDSLESAVDAMHYTSSNPEGVAIVFTLAIMEKSFEWWQEHPDELDNKYSKVPHIVVADAAGAIIAGLMNIAEQNVSPTNKFNWWSFGKDIVVGAVEGSVALTGKLARFMGGFL